MPDLGIGTWLGFAEESTYGTAESRTHYIRAVMAGIQRARSIKPTPELFHDGVDYRRDYAEKDVVGGDFEVLGHYEGHGILLKHLFGSVSTTGPVSSVYTHTYSMADALPTGLTIEQKIGDLSSSEVFEGCKLTRGVLSVDPAGIMRWRFSVLGETSGGIVAAGTPTFSTNYYPILHNHSGQIGFNSVNSKMKHFELEVNNQLAERQLLGSLNTDEPVRQNFREVFIRATLERESAKRAAHYAETQGNVTLTLTRASGSDLAITGYNAKIVDIRDVISSPGIIDQQIVWRCYADGTNKAAKIVIQNSQTTAIAA